MAEPPLSDEYTVAALDTEVRRDLRGLQKDTADSVARHLVAAGSLVDEDPQLALEHARYARRRASRIAVVREAAGIAAYHAGEWAEALAELRAARRMGGGPIHLPVMADIERALGRPERAVDIARGTEAAELGTAGRIELAIVGAGARRDLGELDAAVVGLQIPELDPSRREPWSARLFYAYADNLLAAGRESDALQWFVRAADADTDGETDAVGRIAELTGEDPDDADDFAFGVEDVVPEGAVRAAGRSDAEDERVGGDRSDAAELDADAAELASVGAPVDAGPSDEVDEDVTQVTTADDAVTSDAAGPAAEVDLVSESTSDQAGETDVLAEDGLDDDESDDDQQDEGFEDGATAVEPSVVEDASVEPASVEPASVEPAADEDVVVEDVAAGPASDGGAADGGTADEGSTDATAPVDASADDAATDDAATDDGEPVGTEVDGRAADPSATAEDGTAR